MHNLPNQASGGERERERERKRMSEDYQNRIKNLQDRLNYHNVHTNLDDNQWLALTMALEQVKATCEVAKQLSKLVTVIENQNTTIKNDGVLRRDTPNKILFIVDELEGEGIPCSKYQIFDRRLKHDDVPVEEYEGVMSALLANGKLYRNTSLNVDGPIQTYNTYKSSEDLRTVPRRDLSEPLNKIMSVVNELEARRITCSKYQIFDRRLKRDGMSEKEYDNAVKTLLEFGGDNGGLYRNIAWNIDGAVHTYNTYST